MAERAVPYQGGGKAGGKGMPNEVEATVAQFLTLTPGIFATDANVQKLAAWVRTRVAWVHIMGNLRLTMRVNGRKRVDFLVETLRPSLTLAEETHADGDILKGLVFMKEALATFKAKGTCGCKKRLPAIGQDCKDCVLRKAIEPGWTPPSLGGRCRVTHQSANGTPIRCSCPGLVPADNNPVMCRMCIHTREEHDAID